jgi:hypothetical protein
MEHNIVLEPHFPTINGWLSSLKNPFVPNLPNVPGCTTKDFHKAGTLERGFGKADNIREVLSHWPLNTNKIPALSSKVTLKEKVTPCL